MGFSLKLLRCRARAFFCSYGTGNGGHFNNAQSVCLSVRLSVTTLAKASLGSTLRRSYVQHWYRLSRFLTRGFSKKPSVQKLWREKANMLMVYAYDAATFRLNFRRQGQSLTVGYTLVRQRDTSLSATTAVRVSVSCLHFPLLFR